LIVHHWSQDWQPHSLVFIDMIVVASIGGGVTYGGLKLIAEAVANTYENCAG